MPNPLENGNYNPNLVYIKKSRKECFCVYNKNTKTKFPEFPR